MKSLFVASRGSDAAHPSWRPVGRLDLDGGLYRFQYLHGAIEPGFTPFSGMDDLHAVYESAELFPVFANRLLAKSRPEYEDYLRWNGFAPGEQPDPIAVLSVTEGIRRTDSIEVFPIPDATHEGRYQSKFFVHGLSHLGPIAANRVLDLQPNDPLLPIADAHNPVDPFAVAVRTRDNILVGFVPRYLAKDVRRLIPDAGPQTLAIHVQRVNPQAPAQHRLLCQMSARWPDGFVPCSDAEFQPIPKPALV